MNVKNPSESELREIVFQFPVHYESPYPVYPRIEPIQLSPKQTNNLLALLGGNAKKQSFARKRLREIAEGYCGTLLQQQSVPPSGAKKQLREIEAAADKLITAFNMPDDSTRRTAMLVHHSMASAAEEYGRRIAKLHPNVKLDLPWNFWTADRLVSAIQSAELLKHWAEIAQQQVKPGSLVHKGRSASRVLVQNLALLWTNMRGDMPRFSVSAYANSDRAEGVPHGPFIDFALKFVECLRENVTNAQKQLFPGIGSEISTLTANAIYGHWKAARPRFSHLMAKPAKK